VQATQVIDRTNVLAGIRSSGSNPEKFATQLLQAQHAGVSAECASMSGYEHCTQCAKPALTALVTELIKVLPQQPGSPVQLPYPPAERGMSPATRL
jgi:hypothetical protein